LRINRTTETLWKNGDPGIALPNSTVYLEAFGRSTSSTSNYPRPSLDSICSTAATEPPSTWTKAGSNVVHTRLMFDLSLHRSV
jgi:hypothetical protein